MTKNFPCYWSKVRSCHKDLFEDHDKVFIIGSCDSSRKEFIDIISEIIQEYNLEPVFAERLEENNNLDAFCENICSNVRGSRLIINDISAPLRTYCEEHDVSEYYPSLNVYWEYGYAAGLGKKQIVLCEAEQLEKLPFDVGSKHIQKYSKNDLRSVLRRLLDAELKKPSVREGAIQEKLNDIYNEFQNWAKKKIEDNLKLDFNVKKWDGRIADYIFGCIVPRSLSDNLVNLDLLKGYIDDYSIIKRPQTYKIPEYARQYEESIGEDIIIYPNGIIYFCLIYSSVKPEEPTFSLGLLEAKPHEILVVDGLQKKYSAPFSTITWGKLESLFEVICFIFHPECKIRIVKIPTESFSLELVVPKMIINGKRRILSSHRGLPSYKKYLGEKEDIVIREFFKYKKIPEFVESIKTKITEFYQNPASRGYL